MTAAKAFECRRCGQCCYGEGGIIVLEQEEGRIADFLGISEEEFRCRHCETRNGRTYLRTDEDGWCIYFDRERLCRIHPVKPDRCVQWPYFRAMVSDEDNWELAKDACPGISAEATHAQFVREAEEAGYAASGSQGKDA